MFGCATDPKEALGVFVFVGPLSESDHVAYVAALLEFSERVSNDVTPAIILVNDDREGLGGEPPPAWVKVLAQQTEVSLLLAIVTHSEQVLGILKAVTWLLRSRHTLAPATTFDEAVAWVATRRGVSPARFFDLLRDARLAAAGGDTEPPLN
jgi:hypothetical protein